MPGTYSQLLYHIVFATKHRHPWITPELSIRLYPFIGGIIRKQNAILFDIGGIEDHIHLYLSTRPDTAISDLMRHVKSRSTKWVRQNFPTHSEFAWQESYAPFTVSKSQELAVKNYIANQAEHHKKEDYKSEYRRLLVAHEVPFDERYLFD